MDNGLIHTEIFPKSKKVQNFFGQSYFQNGAERIQKNFKL
jgi:hypothetical protein